MLYYPWEVSFVMHHYHTTLMKNWVCGYPSYKKKRAETLFSYLLSIALLGYKVLRYSETFFSMRASMSPSSARTNFSPVTAS